MLKEFVLSISILSTAVLSDINKKAAATAQSRFVEHCDEYSLKNSANLRCKVNKVCFLKNYDHKLDSFSKFIYIDVEIFGEQLRLDLDDLEARIIEKDGRQTESWAYETIFLDKKGKKTTSLPDNNNESYLHIGVILPATAKAKKVRFYYWENFLCDEFLEIKNVYYQIQ